MIICIIIKLEIIYKDLACRKSAVRGPFTSAHRYYISIPCKFQVFFLFFSKRRIKMPREKITVDIAGVKLNLITSSGKEVMRMANSLEASVRKKMKKTSVMPEAALVLLLLEQTETLKKNTALIHSQQQQIFALTEKNSALLGEMPECGPIKKAENALMSENAKLREEIDRLCDEITRLRSLAEDGKENV